MTDQAHTPPFELADLPRDLCGKQGGPSPLGLPTAIAISLLCHATVAALLWSGKVPALISYQFADETSTTFEVAFSKAAPASEAANHSVQSEETKQPVPKPEQRPDEAPRDPDLVKMELREESLQTVNSPVGSLQEPTTAEEPIVHLIEDFDPSLDFSEEASPESSASLASAQSETHGETDDARNSTEQNGAAQKSRGASLLKKINPVYPTKSREKGQEGTVKLLAQISDTGAILQLKVEQSSGFSLLDQAAQDAVEKWTFSPALREGKSVSVWLRIPVAFRFSG